MKTILGLTFGILMMIVFSSVDTSAQTNRRGINDREHNQRQRIVNGVKSGELTYRETARLAREQAQIRRMEYRFRHSGDGLSSRERARLQRELNQSSRHIYRQKHDRQDYPRYKKM
jgi:hypothetical protein